MQLFGNTTGGMEYSIIIDGSTYNKTSSTGDQSLVYVSGLTVGYHTVTLVAKSLAGVNIGHLVFESAVMTVGTGLFGYRGILLTFNNLTA